MSMPGDSTAQHVHPKNRLNDLSGEEWLYRTKSLWVTSYPHEFGHDLRKAHGANKPPRLMKEIIETFTKGSEWVLDPFAGVGGTLIGAAICEPPRKCLGIEVNRKWIDIYSKVLKANPGLTPYQIIHGDALGVIRGLPDDFYALIATDPPYNTHFKRTMCDGRYDDRHSNRRTDYDMRSEDPADLANLPSYEDYLNAMQAIFAECLRVLAPGRYMTVIIRNAYQDGEYLFTHADLAQRAKLAGFVPKGEIVWYQVGTRLRPYGYPYAFVPNIAHQYILVLRKPC